jgi:hypothetical protein
MVTTYDIEDFDFTATAGGGVGVDLRVVASNAQSSPE